MKFPSRCLWTAAVVAACVVYSRPVVAQVAPYHVLHAFSGVPGKPKAHLHRASDGTLWGMTLEGGEHGIGSIFTLTVGPTGLLNGAYVHHFTPAQGGRPIAGLIEGPDGALYGTTPELGAANLGTAFKITPAGTFTLLHTFTGPDGAKPMASLTLGADGALYGTTQHGGVADAGTIFRLTTTGALTTLHAFSGDIGSFPASPLVRDGDEFIGTTDRGSGSGGTSAVFRLTTAGAFTVIRQFTGPQGFFFLMSGDDGYVYGPAVLGLDPPRLEFAKVAADGTLTPLGELDPVQPSSEPQAPLILMPDGSFYGTFAQASPDHPLLDTGFRGAAIKITKAGTLTVLHTFTPAEGESFSGLTVAPDGKFYGVTRRGGIADHGIVYSLTSDTSFATVGHFTGPDGNEPLAGPVRGSDGAFYGTTVKGGYFNKGTIYRMGADGQVTTLHWFSGVDGANPHAALVRGPDGQLYGTTTSGGCAERGTVYRLNPGGGVTTLHCFQPGEGREPVAPLMVAADGLMYGTTLRGGAGDIGTIFRISRTGTFATLYSFFSDGAFPAGALVQAADGNMYGTYFGLSNWSSGIFRRSADGAVATVAALPRFGGRAFSGLTPASGGAYYAATCCVGFPPPAGFGQIFRFQPGASATLLHDFTENSISGTIGGIFPFGAPVEGADGFLYGPLRHHENGSGAIYRLSPSGEYSEVKVLTESEGSAPSASLLPISSRVFLGTTQYGGPKAHGVIFAFVSP